MDNLHERAMELSDQAHIAMLRGNLKLATTLYSRAYKLEAQAADLVESDLSAEPTRSVLYRSAAAMAIDAGELKEAHWLIRRALSGNPPKEIEEELFALDAVATSSDLATVKKENREVFEEGFEQQINYAKMLMRQGRLEDALRLIDELEWQSGARLGGLPSRLRYLIPFCRANAYVRLARPALAQAELERALELAGSDLEAQARVRNLMGTNLYMQERPAEAIEHHLACVRAIREGAIKDLNFRFSTYYNLGNDYLLCNDIPQAIGSYKRALRVLKDLDASERAADVYWSLALAHKNFGNLPQARMYALRAMQVYQAMSNHAAQAAMQINLAEISIEAGRDTEAAAALDAAVSLLAETGNLGLLSYIHRVFADLARRAGDFEKAANYAEESIRYAKELAAQGQDAEGDVWIDTVSALTEALNAAALIEEERGNTQEADRLFAQAFEQVNKTSVELSKRKLHVNYGTALEARGSYKEAAEQFKAAAKNPSPRSRNLGKAANYAEESIRYAKELAAQGQDAEGDVWIDTVSALTEALNAAALIEEEKGNTQEADQLFAQALEQLDQITVETVKRNLHLSYGTVLEARGSYKAAAAHFKSIISRELIGAPAVISAWPFRSLVAS